MQHNIPIDRPVNILSLGAGVQSSTLLMLYERGVLLPRPDFAIFADTKAEPEAVYRWLDFLTTQTSIPIYIFSKGDLSEEYLYVTQKGKEFNILPVYYKDEDGKKRLGRRQCTNDYKLQVIFQGVRKTLGYKKHKKMRHSINMNIGISNDEITRMKISQVKWITNLYPLVDADMSRTDCKEYFTNLGWPEPPRSACYFCPFQSNADWLNLKENHPADFQKAVDFDNHMRLRKDEYLHQTLKPLSTISFDPKEKTDYKGMDEECDGICGL